MAAVVGSDSGRSCGIECFAKDGMHSHRQRGEDVLLRKAEEWKVALQTHGQNARQVLLQGNVRRESRTKGVNWNGRKRKDRSFHRGLLALRRHFAAGKRGGFVVRLRGG